MKKKLFSSLLVVTFGLTSLFAEDVTFFQKARTSTINFLTHFSEIIGSNLKIVGAWFSETFSQFATWFVNVNQEAYSFLTGPFPKFLHYYWLEFSGVCMFIIGIIVLLCALFYKPKYKLADVPKNAVPLTRKDKKGVEEPNPVKNPQDKETSQSFYSEYAIEKIHPLEEPHVEFKKASQEVPYKMDDPKLANVDAEDLNFFNELSNDFNSLEN